MAAPVTDAWSTGDTTDYDYQPQPSLVDVAGGAAAYLARLMR